MRVLGYTDHSAIHTTKVAEQAGRILEKLGYDAHMVELAKIAGYMHDEHTGVAVDPVSAALILADKTDVRRNRVRNLNPAAFDKHDRVNYAVISASLNIQKEKKVLKLELQLDEEICSMMDYFEIFLQRMLMCRRAASVLGMSFKLSANGNKIC
ncbi:MAG: phosphohydrolase [Clostridiaceae bacterium]|nr:phosphohydrolase [Clostridiaceae bacterium]